MLTLLAFSTLFAGTASAAPNSFDEPARNDAGGSSRYASASSRMRGGSWIALGGFVRTGYGLSEVGATLTVGLALDRIAAGSVHKIRDDPSPAPPASPTDAPEPSPKTEVSPTLARACVRAALRASGLGVDDARLDGIVARSRASASLPELRLRVMRVLTDNDKLETAQVTDSLYYQTLTGGLTLEARMTWRLDRLLYADDEPTMERVRMERVDARQRLATRVLDALFQWQRARLDAASSEAGSKDERDARMRVAEAAATLDVLTAGWFALQNSARPPGTVVRGRRDVD
jgi:hypothetical protein